MAETSAHLGMRPIFSILCDRGCGSVGRAVASEIRGPRFEFIISNTVTCIEKTKIKKMKLVIAHFLKLKGVLISPPWPKLTPDQCDQKKSPNVYKSCPKMISPEK